MHLLVLTWACSELFVGAMAELPFGDNPFSSPAAEAPPKAQPTASFLARQTIPPAANASQSEQGFKEER